MVKIAEAYSGENGAARGRMAGDRGTAGNPGKPSQGGEEVQALRTKWDHNEISSCEIWAYFNSGYITRREALWILR